MTNKAVYLGVDIGGTKVAAGLVNEKGEILSQVRVAMNSTGSAMAGLASVQAAVDQVCGTLDGAAAAIIGASSPGPLDPNSGIVINPPNLPCWRNFPLKAELERVYRVPVAIDNDANAAALAEAKWGAARGYSRVFYATIGTGIGTGWVGQIQAASFTQASQSAMGQCVANKLNAKPGSPYIQPPAFGFGSSFPNPATNIPGNVLNPYVLTQQPGATSPGNVSKLGAASGCTRCTCN